MSYHHTQRTTVKALARFKRGLRLFGAEEHSEYQTLGLLAFLIIPASAVSVMLFGLEGSREIVLSLIIGGFIYLNLLTVGFIYYLGGAQEVVLIQE